VELGIDVKHSAYKLSKQAAEKQKKMTRVCVCIFVVAMMPMTVLAIISGKAKDNPDEASHWILLIYH